MGSKMRKMSIFGNFEMLLFRRLVTYRSLYVANACSTVRRSNLIYGMLSVSCSSVLSRALLWVLVERSVPGRCLDSGFVEISIVARVVVVVHVAVVAATVAVLRVEADGRQVVQTPLQRPALLQLQRVRQPVPVLALVVARREVHTHHTW